jgi:DNA polymerase zeta
MQSTTFRSRSSPRFVGVLYFFPQSSAADPLFCVPQLDRAFSLVGVRVASWYASLPRRHGVSAAAAGGGGGPEPSLRGTVDQYFRAAHCRVCGEPSASVLCGTCARDPAASRAVLSTRRAAADRVVATLTAICRACQGDRRDPALHCVSVDCPVLFERARRVRLLDDAVAHCAEVGV